MCNCFEETLVKIKEHVAPQVPEGAKDLSIDWDGRTYLLSGDEHSPVNPKIKIEYRAPKKGGGHAANLKKDTVSILASHCMFCGYQYKKAEKAESKAA